MKSVVRMTIGALVVALSLATTACEDDGRTGILTDEPAPPTTETATPEPSTTTAAPTTTPPPPVPLVGAVPGNAAAAPALTAWADDLVSLTPDALAARCWGKPPNTVTAQYTDVAAIFAALATPGVDGPYASTWSAGGLSVSAQHSDIATGYACPYVYTSGQPTFYSSDDAAYAVVRFLSRATGRPVNPRDVEAFFPLICPGNSPWDPNATGDGDRPPLKLTPDQLAGTRSFDAEAAIVTALQGDYVAVDLPVTDASGTTKTVRFTLSVGPDGYCLGSAA
ncbi:hypothetical protein ABH922_004870 [Rhodococcus sp. 27YEA15]|uniref:hypothetical protein n=1 Tax=Rhodococcus sp. 27YEA15 TaxID=3156259 RepID=UPI003C7ECB19